MAGKLIPLEKRFWAKVQKGKPDECWNWTGAKHPFGYGKIWQAPHFRPAHQVSFELAGGTIPEGMLIRHTCDNPSCVNPTHLLLGTTKDNVQDKLDRNRGNNGQKHGHAVLTDEQAYEIKHSTLKGVELAAKFNVSPSVISHIRNGKRWKHIL